MIWALAAGAALIVMLGRAPNRRIHEHRCDLCGTCWWHGARSPREAHRCKSCGHMQAKISRYV